jgi:hypothetical protein
VILQYLAHKKETSKTAEKSAVPSSGKQGIHQDFPPTTRSAGLGLNAEPAFSTAAISCSLDALPNARAVYSLPPARTFRV